MNAFLFPAALGLAAWWPIPRLVSTSHPAARAGFSLLLGIGAATTLLMLAGLAGLPLTRSAATVVTLLLLVVGWFLRGTGPPAGTPASRWNPAAWLLLALLAIVFLSSAWRAGFYPISAMDAHGYDGRARWIVAEKTLNLAIYREPGFGAAGNLTYPPLQPLALALGYWAGAPEGKPVDSIWFGAILLVVYGSMRPRIGRAGALLAALLLASAPEFWRHGSLALTNLPAAAFTGAALLAVAGGARPLLPGALLAMATGVRPDAVAMAFAIGLSATGIAAESRGARFRRFLWLVAPALGLLVAWQLALRGWIGATSASAFRSSPVPDPSLLAAVLGAGVRLAINPGLYGWCLVLFVLGAIPGRDRDSWFLTRATLAMALFLVVLFQQLDPTFGGGGGSYLENSLKRDLFYLLPGAVTAGLSSPKLRALVERLDG